MNYTIGDTIYFLFNGTMSYGQITNAQIVNDTVTYTVTDSLGFTYQVNQNDAYPNAFSLVTPTPSPTTSAFIDYVEFSIGDTIYFMDNGVLLSGVCTNVINDNNTLEYTVLMPSGVSETIAASNAFPSPISIASPTPTASSTPTPTLTKTPQASATVSITPSATYANVPNNFLIYDSGTWSSSTNTTIESTEDHLIFTSTTNGTPVICQRSFTVIPNSYYGFGFDYEQGTIRYFKIKLESNDGSIFVSSGAGPTSGFGAGNIEVNHGNTIVFGEVGDSGRFNTEIYVPDATQLTLTLEFYEDSNYNSYPDENFKFSLSLTYLQQIINSVSMTPTQTTTPTPTPTRSHTVSITRTPTYIPLSCYGRLTIADSSLIYYKFDEAIGTSAAIDYSGNNINGTYHNVILHNPPLVDGAGYSAKFGGSLASYVVSNNDNRYKTIYNDFSIEFSLQTTDTQVPNNIIFSLPLYTDPLTATLNSTINSSGYFVFNITTVDGIYSLISNVPVTDGTKRLFSITRENNTVNLYINSGIVDQVTVSGQNQTGTNFLYIGGFADDPQYNYNGIIDDFSIYKIALSESQIDNHYNCWLNTNSVALTPTPTPSITPSGGSCRNIILASSPLGYWRLDDSDKIARDAVGTHNGNLNGSVLVNQPSLASNISDASMSNNNNGYINVFPLRRDFSFASNNFSIAFYASVNDYQVSDSPILIAKVADDINGTFNYAFTIDVISGNGVFTTYINGNPYTLETSTPINDLTSRLFHIVRQDRIISIYINAVLDASMEIQDSGILDTGLTDLEFFGSQYIPNSYFFGSLDEISIYGRALTNAEIIGQYQCGSIVTPTPSPTRTISYTPSPTRTITPTHTKTPTITPTISVTPSITTSISITPTISLTPTITPTISVTPSITPTITFTPTQNPTQTRTPSPTRTTTPTITNTPSVTPTISNTPSTTPTITVTPTISSTISVTPSITPTITITPTISFSNTPAVTHTRTLTPTPTLTPTISVTTSVPANPYAQSILNSLQNWWDMNESSSANRVDSKDKVIMTPSGDITTVNGQNGNAAQFNPQSYDSALSSTLSENIVNYNTSFSVGAFVKLDSLLLPLTPQNKLTILSRVNDNSRYQMELSYDKSTGQVSFTVSNNGANTTSVTTANVTSTMLDQWTLITGGYDKVNGQLYVSINKNITVLSYSDTYYSVTQPFVIGNTGLLNSPWAGEIDAAFICLKYLSQAEINYLYNSGLGTDFNKLLSDGFIVDTGKISQYYGGDSLSSFTNVGGIINPNAGLPQPAFEYDGATYSYKQINVTDYFDRAEFDFMLGTNSVLDFFIASESTGFGSYLKLTANPNDFCGISQCLTWTDYEEPTAVTRFDPIVDGAWHHGLIKINYIDNIRYFSVYIDGNCRIYYFPIGDGNIFYGFGNEVSNTTSLIDNVTVYTTVYTPDVTVSVTPSTTLNPSPTPSITQTRTPTPTPSVSNSVSMTPSVTPSASFSNNVITSDYTTNFTDGNRNYFQGSSFSIATCGDGQGLYTLISGGGATHNFSSSSTVKIDFNLSNDEYVYLDFVPFFSIYGSYFVSGTYQVSMWIDSDNPFYTYPLSISSSVPNNGGSVTNSGNKQYPSFTMASGRHSLYIQVSVTAYSQGVPLNARGTFCMNNFAVSIVPPPTVSATATITPTPSVSPSGTLTPTPTVTRSITFTPTVTTTITPTVSQTPSITTSNTITPTLTVTPSITKTITPTLSQTPSITTTNTITPTPTVTLSISTTNTPTVTPTLTQTPSVTASITVSNSPSITPTISVTPSITRTITPTPSVTTTITPTVSLTITPTLSITPTTTITPTPSSVATNLEMLYTSNSGISNSLKSYKRNSDGSITGVQSSVASSGFSNAGAISPDQKYYIAADNTNAFVIRLFNISSSTGALTFNKTVSMPGAYTTYPAISPNGLYVAAGSGNTGTTGSVSVFAFNSSTAAFTSVSLSANIPNGLPSVIEFTRDSQYMIVGSSTSSRLYVYQVGTTFTYIGTISGAPATPTAIHMSPNNQLLAIGFASTAPSLIIYQNNNNGTFTALPTQPPTPTNTINGLRFSHAGDYLAVATNATSNALVLYSVNGTSINMLASIPSQYTTNAYSVDWSIDDSNMAVSWNNSTTPISIYSTAGGTFTKLPDSTYYSGVVGYLRYTGILT